MNKQSKHFGFTLIELMVVMGLIVLLVSLSMPAINALNSSTSTSSAKTMISAALSSARAIAAQNQKYAGVRFQRDSNKNQYMIFIIQDNTGTNLANRFYAVQGRKPTKLPDGVWAMDMKLASQVIDNIDFDVDIDEQWELTDTTTFSIVFSPSGKLVLHPVWVVNKDATRYNDTTSKSKVFNTKDNVQGTIGYGMFIQDDYPAIGLTQESSRNYLVICEREKFESVYNAGNAYNGYLYDLYTNEPVYINPYSGTIIIEPVRAR